MANSTLSYQCPHCLAPLAYAPRADKITCEYCGSSFTPAELDEFLKAREKRAVESETAAEKSWQTAKAGGNWSETELASLRTFVCESCGAQVSCDENTMATECCYCGNPSMIASRFNGMLRPDYVIPFATTKEDAVAALKNFYGGKLLLPSAFTKNNRIESIQPMYVPYWLFDSDIDIEATFEATHNRVFDTPDAVITETDVYVVTRTGKMSFRHVPVDGSSKMDNVWMESIEPFDLRALKPFSPAYLAGFLADKYDVPAEECAPDADNRLSVTAANVLQNSVTGYASVGLKQSSFTKSKADVSYAMAPVWILTTRYNDQPYTFLMNGQTGKVAGELPVDSLKAFLYPFATFAVSLTAFYFLFAAWLK